MLFRRPSLIVLVACLVGVATGVVWAADGDSLNAWQRWPSIDAAIALRALDGPDDIIEKAEIIEDRVDRMQDEQRRLTAEDEASRERTDALIRQRLMLQDLAEIQLGGNPQTKQRLSDLAGRLRNEKSRRERLSHSLAELKAEIQRLEKLALDYREKARELRIREGGKP